MTKEEFNKIIADARKTPSTEEIVAKLTGVKKPEPIKESAPTSTRKRKRKQSIEAEAKPSPQDQFLKQIEAYNDFIIQNDLDAEKIDPEHDYDFTAFTSPEDWAVESERLADRLNDRKIEIKQNEDAGEFEGKELEGGMPSFEEVQNMDEDEFKAYEAKYLTPNDNEFKEAVVEAPVAKEPVVT